MPAQTSPVSADPDATADELLLGEEAPRRSRGLSLRRPTREEALRWAGDGVALGLLAAVLLWWEMFDGGRNRPEIVIVAAIALLAAPVLISELKRFQPAVQALFGAYGLGWLVALAFAVDRHGWVTPLLVLGLVPYVGMAARRIWRRPWGPTVLLGLLLFAFGRYTFRSWLQWWGATLRESQPLWMPLSWRNQSGVLMGAFGLLFLGVAWAGRRIVRWGLVLLAGAAFAGLWLSSSRGAIAFTVGATAVMLVAGLRSLPSARQRLGLAGATAGALAMAAATSFVLLSMLPTGAGTPLESRNEAAAGNAVARLNHMEAALRMFADRPLVGQGPGSYEIMALDHTDPDANLTTSAHDEYVEVLGEGGLVGGLPFLLLHVAIAVLVWRRLRRGVTLSDDPLVDVRGAMTLGFVGVVVLIASHSAFDFDWDYPVLPALLAIGAGALSVRPSELAADARGPQPAPPEQDLVRTRMSWAGAPLVLLLVVALAGHAVEFASAQGAEGLSVEEYASYGAPWDAELRGGIAAGLMRDGHLGTARAVIDDAIAWNPGIDRLRRIRAMIRYEQGELDVAGLVATLERGRSRFPSYLDIADVLIEDGEFEAAGEVLDDVQAQMKSYGNWGVNSLVVDAGVRQIVVARELEGCDSVRATADELRATPAVESLTGAEEAIDRAVTTVCP